MGGSESPLFLDLFLTEFFFVTSIFWGPSHPPSSGGGGVPRPGLKKKPDAEWGRLPGFESWCKFKSPFLIPGKFASHDPLVFLPYSPNSTVSRVPIFYSTSWLCVIPWAVHGEHRASFFLTAELAAAIPPDPWFVIVWDRLRFGTIFTAGNLLGFPSLKVCFHSSSLNVSCFFGWRRRYNLFSKNHFLLHTLRQEPEIPWWIAARQITPFLK